MKTARTLLTLSAATLLLAACNVGPTYTRPSLDLPDQFGAASQPSTQPAQSSHLAANWWTLFNDAKLTELEEAAVAHNPDLKAAYARVKESRAAVGIAASEFYPAIGFDPTVLRTRSSNTTASNRSNKGKTSTAVSIPFDLSYEIDIWGRVQNSVASAQSLFSASESDFAVVLLTLEADVAQNYFNLLALDAQQKIFDQTVELLNTELQLFSRQREVGVATELNVAQARAQLEAEVAQQEEIRRQRADIEHALAILTGQPPAKLHIADNVDMMEPPAIPAGLPADILRQRPDVFSAEQNLIAANASVGVATANFYPVVKLTGVAGFQSMSLASALDWESRVFAIGPTVSFPIFEGGRLTSSLKQARSRYEELMHNYRSTVLTAFREVEDSLSDLHFRAESAKAQDRAVTASQDYFRIASLQYKAGTINSLTVLDAHRTLLTNQLTAVQIKNQRLVSTILLLKAMGGGWNPDDPTSLPEKPETPETPNTTNRASTPATATAPTK